MMKRTGLVLLLLVALTGSLALDVLAGEQMAFQQGRIRSMPSGEGIWKTLTSIPFRPPQDGYVVVTASGMVLFDSEASSLTLTLSTTPAGKSKSDWVFSLTPGFQLLQAYTIRYVFPVKAKEKKKYYLNAMSWDGPRNSIRIENGLLTVEFYAGGNVSALSREAVKTAATPATAPEDQRVNQ
ncbi:MAG: hypothetical protein KBH99_04040 [Syntrophobacteraceae bacterium]|nr:hypothetical protein [Syntrophobacteraceae bacterium]